ncbi:MAG TPA: hypothetical protein VMN79_12000 [Casimicrobiaceae bacterium]|nr:hypothetical protein [Casimicrobiaceae bacterium]
MIARVQRAFAARVPGAAAAGSESMNPIPRLAVPAWSLAVGTAVTTVSPLWLLLAGAIAATMGTWPPHICL